MHDNKLGFQNIFAHRSLALAQIYDLQNFINIEILKG